MEEAHATQCPEFSYETRTEWMAQLFSASEQWMVAGRLGKKIRIQSAAQPMYLFKQDPESDVFKYSKCLECNTKLLSIQIQNSSGDKSKYSAHQVGISHLPWEKTFNRRQRWGATDFILGGLPDLGIKPGSPALQADSLLTELQGKPVGISKGP